METLRDFLRLVIRLYDFRILASIIGLWLGLYILPDGIFGDHLNLKQSIEAGTFTRVLQSFISAFGFLITILVLAYGFVREKFRRLALREFLDNKYSVVLISLFISVFIFNIASNVYIDSQKFTHTSLNFAYASLIVSIAYFFFFLPFALYSISFTDAQTPLKKYVDQLEVSYFPEYPYNEFKISFDEYNPIVVLSNLSRVFMEKDDFHSVNGVILMSQIRIAELIGASKDRNLIGRYLSGQKVILEAIFNKCIQKKEYHIIEKIFLSVKLYHHHFAHNNIPLLYLEEITFFIHSMVERLVKEGANETIERVLIEFEKILEEHYSISAPNEKDLPNLMEYYGQEFVRQDLKTAWEKADTTTLQWQKISSDIPYVFSIILNSSIQYKNLSIFEQALSTIQHLLVTVHHSNMGIFQKAWATRELLGQMHFYQIEAIKKDLIKDAHTIKWIDSFVMSQIVDEDLVYKKDILEATSEFLLELFSTGKLHPEIINFLGSIGRHCANNYQDSNRYSDTLGYILKVLCYLKTKCESALDNHIEIYQALKQAFESFIKFQKMSKVYGWKEGMPLQKETHNKDLVQRLESLTASFRPMDPGAPRKISW